MAILEEIPGYPDRLMMECPGCKMLHHVRVGDGPGPRWGWNGSFTSPTFTPSILVTYTWGEEQKNMVCHSFIKDGVWQFLSDCTHELAGQFVPMIEVE